MESIPQGIISLSIIGAGLFITGLIVVYYVVKAKAHEQGWRSGYTEGKSKQEILTKPVYYYEIMFENGISYKFSGVKLDIEEDDEGNVTRFKTSIDDNDADELSDDDFNSKYNQCMRYIDYSQIMYINQTIQYHKYSI